MALVFIHRGYSAYMEFTLRQARHASPDSEIFLLGDTSNDRFDFVTHVDTTTPDYAAEEARIAEVYRHMSTNRRSFELYCFQRWFVLAHFMRSQGLDEAFVLDTDVLLYASEDDLRAMFLDGETTLGVCQPEDQSNHRWVASPHVSYWTRAQAEAFCTFIIDSYTQPELLARYEKKWNHGKAHGLISGICDMTALYCFAEAQPPSSVVNFLYPQHGAAVDAIFGISDNWERGEFEVGPLGKRVDLNAELPHGRRADGGVTMMPALHFQGKSKGVLPKYYRGPSFPHRSALATWLRSYYAALRVASAVRVRAVRLLQR